MLVVDGEPAMRSMLRSALQSQGYEVLEAGGGREARALMVQERVDLCLIDPALSDLDGLGFIRELRAQHPAPIVVMSPRAQAWRQVHALDAGADEYLVKPVPMDVLHARLRALLRRSRRARPHAASRWQVGDVTLDLEGHTVHRGGEPLRLTGTQWRLLQALCRRAGEAVPAGQLLRAVWGPDHDAHRHYLRVYIHRLRQCLEPDPGQPVHLVSEPGVGYRLRAVPQGERVDHPDGRSAASGC